MTPKEIFQDRYDIHLSLCEGNDVYGWAASDIFNLATYDGDLDKLFVRVIVDVCKVIFARQTYEFIKDEAQYIAYILVCQLLRSKGWIDWGTSIRGVWFDEGKDAKPIYDGYGCEESVPFTKENLIALIEFIEEHEPKEEVGDE